MTQAIDLFQVYTALYANILLVTFSSHHIVVLPFIRLSQLNFFVATGVGWPDYALCLAFRFRFSTSIVNRR